jgi:DNA-binding XRE family transcriptional regulator
MALLLKGDPLVVGKQFGQNLAEARGWIHLTQGELAARASLSQKDVSVLERGLRCPRLDTIVRLADALELQVRDLLFGIE